MEKITKTGKTPLLVGGTMFYFHALEFGLSELPSADPETRLRLAEAARREGWAGMHRRLQIIDPDSAARIHPNDERRIQRALEIYELTGQPPSTLGTARSGAVLPYHIVKIALWPQNRQWLHARITQRFDSMLEQGFVAEVEHLRLRANLSQNAPSMRTVGYRHIWKYLTKKINYSEMREQAIAATRQFAKRQITWLRSYPAISVFDSGNSLLNKEYFELLRKIMRL